MGRKEKIKQGSSQRNRHIKVSQEAKKFYLNLEGVQTRKKNFMFAVVEPLAGPALVAAHTASPTV
jgi:hypothetical protein